MQMRTWLTTPFVLLATLGAANGARFVPVEEVGALGGEWLYVEDRTEGRAVEDRQPPMSMRFALRVEEDAVVMVRGQGDRRREERIPLDGSTIEVADASTMRIALVALARIRQGCIEGRLGRSGHMVGCRGCVANCLIAAERKRGKRAARDDQNAKSESTQWRARSWMERKIAATELEKLGVGGLPASSLKAKTKCFVQRLVIGNEHTWLLQGKTQNRLKNLGPRFIEPYALR